MVCQKECVIPEFKFALREDLKNNKEFLPTRGEPFATGYDVRAAQPDRKPIIIKPGDYFKIPLGFKTIPEEGWWFNLHPRSSSFVKKHMHNLIGVIDEHFMLETVFAGQLILPKLDLSGPDLVINFGDAIGQIIPIKRVDMNVKEVSNEEYDELCSKRISFRNGGFGSTTS